jgi:hypothetical protein
MTSHPTHDFLIELTRDLGQCLTRAASKRGLIKQPRK